MKPWYPMPPFIYEQNRMLMITFKTSPDVLQTLVPKPLIVNPDSLITVFVADLNITKPEKISYFEAGIFISTSYNGKEGSYTPVLYLDQSLPITIGREIWGYPKVQADKFVLKVEGDVVHARVVKDGVALIDATLHLTEVRPPKTLEAVDYVLKLIPSVAGNGAFDVKQLTSTLVQQTIDESRSGEAVLHLDSTTNDPLGEIPILKVVNGFYASNCSFVLDYGEVLYDYIASESMS